MIRDGIGTGITGSLDMFPMERAFFFSSLKATPSLSRLSHLCLALFSHTRPSTSPVAIDARGLRRHRSLSLASTPSPCPSIAERLSVPLSMLPNFLKLLLGIAVLHISLRIPSLVIDLHFLS